MAFSNTNPPKRAGDYSRFITTQAQQSAPSTGSTVCIPVFDDWGPIGVPTLIRSLSDYGNQFTAPDPGSSNWSRGWLAIYNAFKGEAADETGAGGVYAYRIAGASAAAATTTLVAASVTVLTLTAKYKGTKGNLLKREVVANATNPSTQIDVNIFLGNQKVESYGGYGDADIARLQADINKRSAYFIASGAGAVRPDASAAAAATGGDSGSTVLNSDWTTFMQNVEPFSFGYVATDTEDTAIITLLDTWVADLNGREKSKRFFAVHGGMLNETYSTAAIRSAAADNENIINLGVGSYRDTLLNVVFSTAQLAPRLAGIAAYRGDKSSLTFAQLDDLEIVVGPNESDIAQSLDGGVVVLTQGLNRTVRVEKGVTTYTNTQDASKPFETYSVVKYVTTMQDFERENREANENGTIIGRLTVNRDTRDELVTQAQKRLDARIERKSVQPGARVMLSADVEHSDDDEFVALDWVGKFGRSLEQVRHTFFLS